MSEQTIQLLPIFLEVDGVPVLLVELSKHTPPFAPPFYIASVRIIYKGIHSRVFPLVVRDTTDLINKLKVEITKVKYIDFIYGLEEVKRLIT